MFGNCRFISSPNAGTFPIGYYDGEALKANGVDKSGWPDATSSIIIPKGLTIQAWKGSWFDGDFFTLAGPQMIDLCTS